MGAAPSLGSARDWLSIHNGGGLGYDALVWICAVCDTVGLVVVTAGSRCCWRRW